MRAGPTNNNAPHLPPDATSLPPPAPPPPHTDANASQSEAKATSCSISSTACADGERSPLRDRSLFQRDTLAGTTATTAAASVVRPPLAPSAPGAGVMRRDAASGVWAELG